MLQICGGKFAIRADEDFIAPGRKLTSDKFNTGGATVTWQLNEDITLALGIAMITGKGDPTNTFPNKKDDKRESYDPLCETPHNYRSGAGYFGIIYKGIAYLVGDDRETRLHKIQNAIHNFNWVNTPYFYNMNYKTKLWSYFGNYSNSTLIY